MTKGLKQIVLILFVIQIILCGRLVYAAAPSNADGDLVVSETLALRCNLDADNSEITDDCIERLAYDYKSGKTLKGESFDEEKQQIIGDYVKHYIQMSAKGLLTSSTHKDNVAKMTCVDSSEARCKKLSTDIRNEMEDSNKLATNNANMLLNTIKMQSATTNLENMVYFLDTFIPGVDADISDTSLAPPPENKGGQNE